MMFKVLLSTASSYNMAVNWKLFFPPQKEKTPKLIRYKKNNNKRSYDSGILLVKQALSLVLFYIKNTKVIYASF